MGILQRRAKVSNGRTKHGIRMETASVGVGKTTSNQLCVPL